MSDIIDQANQPQTRASIREDLRNMGVEKGMTVMVHSSLSSIGWVNGGGVAVTQALMDVVTEEGTIIMPSQSDDMSNPSDWNNPPVPEEWVKVIKETMPAYHPDYTPASRMGKVVEVFRTFPDVVRSSHPLLSFVAWGKNKNLLMDHPLEFGLGETSPLKKLYDRDAFVLMIGTGYGSCTSFHLAEYRASKQEIVTKEIPMFEKGERVWKEYQDLDFREDLFPSIGEDFEERFEVTEGKIGSAKTRLFSMKDAVDYAKDWLDDHDQ